MPVPIKRYPIVFNRGLYTSRSPSTVAPIPVKLVNCWVTPDDDEGSIEVMPGYKIIDSSTETAEPARLVMSYRDGAGDTYFGWIQQDIIGAGINHGVFRWIKIAAQTTGNYLGTTAVWYKVPAIVASSYAFCFSGDDDDKIKIALSNNATTAIGVTRPDITNATTSLTTVATTSTANLGGVYKYFISEMSATTEGALSLEFGEIDSEGLGKDNDPQAIVVDLSHASFSGSTYRIYRTYNEGAQPFYLATVVGSTTYVDNISDEDLGDLPWLHGDPPPDDVQDAVFHFGRVFLLVGSTLYWSDLGNVESFWVDGSGNAAPIFPDDGDKGTALARDRDGILFFKQNHLYKILGRVPDQFYVTEITLSDSNNTSVGTPSRWSLAAIKGGVAFWWNGGVYIYSGGSVRKISDPIADKLLSYKTYDGDQVALGFDSTRDLLYVSWNTGSGQGDDERFSDYTLVYDTRRNEWIGEIDSGLNSFLMARAKSDPSDNLPAATGEWSPHHDVLAATGLGTTAGDTLGKVLLVNSPVAVNRDTYWGSTEMELSPFFGSSLDGFKRFNYVDVTFEPVTGVGDPATVVMDVELYTDDDSSNVVNTQISVASSLGRITKRVYYGAVGRELTIRIVNAPVTEGTWKVYSMVVGYQDLPGFGN